MSTTLAEKAVKIAVAEIGVREVGSSNTGVRVREYQSATTLGGTGWPWCAAFVAWVLKQTLPGIKWSNSASCDVIWADAKARGLVVTNPKPGDVFLVRAKISGGYSKTDMIHTGFVRSISGSTFTTVEGNSNDSGSREGYEVCSNTRQIGERFYFVRPFLGQEPAVVVAATPWRVLVAGKTLTAITENNTNLIKARDYAEALRLSIGWDAENQAVILAGREVPAQVRLINGASYFPVRVLADHSGLGVTVNYEKRMVRLD